MTTSKKSTAAHPLEPFVDQLLQTGGTFTLLVDHMARFDASRPPELEPGPRFDTVLAGLLPGVLEPLTERFAAGELEAATAILAATLDLVGEEVFLVDENFAGS